MKREPGNAQQELSNAQQGLDNAPQFLGNVQPEFYGSQEARRKMEILDVKLPHHTFPELQPLFHMYPPLHEACMRRTPRVLPDMINKAILPDRELVQTIEGLGNDVETKNSIISLARMLNASEHTDTTVRDNFRGLVKSYPWQMCHTIIDVSHISFLMSIGECADLECAADITFTCDVKKMTSETLRVYGGAEEYKRRIDEQMQKAENHKIARNKYIDHYIQYFSGKYSTAMSSKAEEEPKPKSLESIIKDIPMRIPHPPKDVVDELFNKNGALRKGGELHNLMITTAISARYPDAGLEPSLKDDDRLRCLAVAIQRELEKKDKKAVQVT